MAVRRNAVIPLEPKGNDFMDEQKQSEFKGWAKVEVMGHQSHIGYVETQAFGGVVLFRVDTPGLPEEPERTLIESEWTDEGRLPVGSIVKRGATEGISVLVGAGSIYRIVPCTEEAAILAIRQSVRRPLMVVSVPEPKQLAAVTVDLYEPKDELDEDGF